MLGSPWRGGGALPAPCGVPGAFQAGARAPGAAPGGFLGCRGAVPGCAGQRRKSVTEGNQSAGVAVETRGETRTVAASAALAGPCGARPGEGWHTAPRVPRCGPGGLPMPPFWDVPKGSCIPRCCCCCWGRWRRCFGGCAPPQLCCAPRPSPAWGTRELPFL